LKVITRIADLRRLRQELSEPVGLVPTMGCLHEGHLSLVRKAREENPSLVVSIFVNPTQFGPGEDFVRYPRDVDGDLALLKQEMVDIVLVPEAAEMYPPQFDSWVEVGGPSERLEGASRPGHFRGVTTVCAKLFNIVQPTRAYFGQKDAQQAVVIKKMVAELNMNLEIVTLPTVREPDGLAMSSRNVYLTPDEREQAPALHRALKAGARAIRAGERSPAAVKRVMRGVLTGCPGAKVDYLEVVDLSSLETPKALEGKLLLAGAVWFGRTRLIDNVIVRVRRKR
jgi:pantoate--beta-alanine ligase